MARQKRNGAARALSLVLLTLSLALALSPEGFRRRGGAAAASPAATDPEPAAPPQKPPTADPDSDCDASFTVTYKTGNTYDFNNTSAPTAGVNFKWTVYDENNKTVPPTPQSSLHLLGFQFPKSDKDVTYEVWLEASGKPCGGDPDDEVEYVLVPGIKADFDYEQTGCPDPPLVVRFWDKSYGQGLSYEWTISSSAGTTTYVNQHPIHFFPSADTYTVCLKVTAANGMTDQTCETITVDTKCKPSFDYVYDACSTKGKPPQQATAVFTNTSKGGFCPQTFDWRFSASANYVNNNSPTVTQAYPVGTQHAVTLLMKDGQGCETSLTKNIYFRACAADFIYTVCPTGRVVFQTGAENPEWSFPGATPSSGSGDVVVVHYGSPGKYRARMVSVDKNRCRCVVEKEIKIPGLVKCTPNDTETGNYGFTYKGKSYQLRYKVAVRSKNGSGRIKAKAFLYVLMGLGYVPAPAREISAEFKGHVYTSDKNCVCNVEVKAHRGSGVKKLRPKAVAVDYFPKEFCVRDQEMNATFTVKVDKSHTPVVRTLLVGFPTNKCKY